MGDGDHDAVVASVRTVLRDRRTGEPGGGTDPGAAAGVARRQRRSQPRSRDRRRRAERAGRVALSRRARHRDRLSRRGTGS